MFIATKVLTDCTKTVIYVTVYKRS